MSGVVDTRKKAPHQFIAWQVKIQLDESISSVSQKTRSSRATRISSEKEERRILAEEQIVKIQDSFDQSLLSEEASGAKLLKIV